VDSVQESVFLALARAEDAVSRLDEHLARSELADGWRNRLDFEEAAAWAWSASLFAPLEDLVLHDAGLDVRMPSQDLSRAHRLVRARRKAKLGGIELLAPEGALWLAGRGERPGSVRLGAAKPARQDTEGSVLARCAVDLETLARGTAEGPGVALREWSSAVRALEGHAPDLLVAAFALDAWRIVQPLPREDYVGAALVSVWLRSRLRVGSHLLGLEGAFRKQGPLPSRVAADAPPGRLRHYLEGLQVAGELGRESLRRLELVRQVLDRQVSGRRAGSRARDLAELLLASPVVSAPMAAERLGISQQAVRSLVPSLGSSVRELTGRRRFKAWRV